MSWKYVQYDGGKYRTTDQGGGGGGNVDDVEVNGVSVVNAEKVAEITSYKEVTQNQYDNLPATKTSDGVMYCITDAQGGGGGSYPSTVPIYLGSQVIVSGAKSTTSTRENIWLKYRDANPFPFPITVPAEYSIKYRLSAAGSTAEANQAICGINGVDLVNCGTTWTGNDNDFTNTAFSDLFSFSDLPSETAYKYGTTTDAFNLYIKSSISGKRAYLNNITLHYYLVAV